MINKTIISLTTTCARVNRVHEVIHSIERGKRQPDEIVLNVSRNSGRRSDIRGGVKDSDLKNVRKTSAVINWCEDVGPFTKIYSQLKKYRGRDDILIITIDDDVIYPDTFLQELIKAEKENPNKVLCYRTRTIKFDSDGNPLEYSRWPLDSEPPYFLTGLHGCAYKPYFFSDSVFDLDKLFSSYCFYQDDFWLFLNLKVDVIRVKKRGQFRNYGGNDNFALFNINKCLNDETIRQNIDFFRKFKR